MTAKKGLILKRAEDYVKEYRQKAADESRLKREARLQGSVYVPAEAKLLFVIRIKGSILFFRVAV